MKKIIFALLSILPVIAADAQSIYITKTGSVTFHSRSTVEKVEAENNEVSSVLNTQNGEMVFAILLKSFHFDRALMEEHFNENYVESNKFPKSTFKGKITNLADINLTRDGTYTTSVEGDMNLHGITKRIKTMGSLTIKSGKVQVNATFTIKLADFNITIPALVEDKISEQIDITVDCRYDKKN
ncbi:MAG: YceI family protein [Chitinophagaceae bacterium]|nr:YceI family protein [Chitinophagaceae bacterium]